MNRSVASGVPRMSTTGPTDTCSRGERRRRMWYAFPDHSCHSPSRASPSPSSWWVASRWRMSREGKIALAEQCQTGPFVNDSHSYPLFTVRTTDSPDGRTRVNRGWAVSKASRQWLVMATRAEVLIGLSMVTLRDVMPPCAVLGRQSCGPSRSRAAGRTPK